MRHAVVFCIFFLLPLATDEYTQELFADIGLEMGLNTATLNFSREAEEWKPLSRFRIAAFINVPLSRQFEFQPEIHYVGKGAKAEGTFLNMPIVYKVRLDYIEISSLMKYRFSKSKRLQPNLLAGGFAAFNIGARTVMEYTSESLSEAIRDDIEKVDFGLIFGAGLDLNLRQGKFLLDFRFNTGMKSIKKASTVEYTIKNNSLSVMLGYSF